MGRRGGRWHAKAAGGSDEKSAMRAEQVSVQSCYTTVIGEGQLAGGTSIWL